MRTWPWLTIAGALIITTVTVLGQVSGGGVSYVPSVRDVTTTVCPSNAAVLAGCDITLSGTADQVTINAAIGGLAGTSYCPAIGCTMRLRSGLVSTTGPIIIDRSYVNLEGESSPMWGGYIRPWTSTSLPVASIATNSTTIQVVSGTGDVIQLNDTNIPDNGESRHRAVRVANLYIVGNSYNGIGINFYNANDDSTRIYNVMVQRVAIGIKYNSDSGVIDTVNIQDVSGDGIDLYGLNNRVVNSLIFDVGGIGINAFGTDPVIIGNKIGDCASAQGQVFLNAQGTLFVGNNVGAGSAYAINFGYGTATVTGNNIDYNTGGYATKVRSVAAINVPNAETNISITANTFVAHGTEPAGVFAVNLNSSTGNTVVGNSFSTGWNNATQPFVSGVTGNYVAGNIGDALTGTGVPTISSGFGTGASVTQSNGAASFSINVGTGGTASSGVVGLPTAPHGWACSAADVTTPTGDLTQQTASSTNSATFTNYVRTTGVAGAWTASDVLQISCQWN